MSATVSFYLEQVAKCATEAQGAALDNQRAKYLDAQAAWQELADRALHVQTEREKRDAARVVVLQD
jgi:hypothetical protein